RIRTRGPVWLVPGDIRLSHFEEICPQAWTEALAGQPRGFRVSTALYRLVAHIVHVTGADLVLVDLGPNVNALNRTALISADGFVVPMALDRFSVMALPSVGQSIARWIREWRIAIQNRPLDPPLAISLPKGEPIPLGYLSQQFSIYRKEASAAYKRW